MAKSEYEAQLEKLKQKRFEDAKKFKNKRQELKCWIREYHIVTQADLNEYNSLCDEYDSVVKRGKQVYYANSEAIRKFKADHPKSTLTKG